MKINKIYIDFRFLKYTTTSIHFHLFIEHLPPPFKEAQSVTHNIKSINNAMIKHKRFKTIQKELKT